METENIVPNLQLSLKDSIFRNFTTCNKDSIKAIIYRVDELRDKKQNIQDEVVGYTNDAVLIKKFLDSFPSLTRVNGARPKLTFYSYAWLYFICGKDTMELYMPPGCGEFSCKMGLFETDCDNFYRTINLIRLPENKWKPYRKKRKKSRH